ncbi:hypothetical protein DFQ28_005143 [Apophysomyces sp. BC1034]|nr:hypothetical protein DFQ30_000913 [Apophysomyces sp. BC1015]KAG0180251.1 hypothetical protein DFQ29_000985 [Apophysomyces sp. BC1021]KAG0188286.1 hypothetical protein DFQ28_005143 [Apophysomyces sp. BC1034]
MNSLPFGSFHAKHFGQEQILHWNHVLGIHSQQAHHSQLASPSYFYSHNYDQNYAEGDVEVEEVVDRETNVVQQPSPQAEGEYYIEDSTPTTLSKEAIEIFRFSEAYRKEREQLDKEMDDTEEDEDSWDFNESSVAHRHGIEAPATCLIRTQASLPESTQLRFQEQLLNSAYLESCVTSTGDAKVTLWPVLPLRL